MSIRASVGQRGVNKSADATVVQQLLNRQSNPAYTFGPIDVDGQVGPQTISAITTFQRKVVRFSNPDGRVDPGGRTLRELEQGAARNPSPAPPKPKPTPGLFTLTFKHGGVVPTASGAGMYESAITLAGPKTGLFRGSIYPNDMSVKGRLIDGTYDLSLTFHRKNGTPTPADLIVKTQGDLRPALTVNGGNAVPVKSNNPSKTTSVGINVHNGFNSNRGSEGCLTLQPTDWSRFITLFLDLYPDISDWYAGSGSWKGKVIGKLIVKA